jgi:hypothetical protein
MAVMSDAAANWSPGTHAGRPRCGSVDRDDLEAALASRRLHHGDVARATAA